MKDDYYVKHNRCETRDHRASSKEGAILRHFYDACECTVF